MENIDTKVLDGGLFQSQEWLDFQSFCHKKTWSRESFIYGIMQNLPLSLGTYGYAPRFPGRSLGEEECNMLLDYAQSQKWVFLRVEPQTNELKNILEKATKSTLKESIHDVQPREILMLALEESEEVLLKNMKSKTRYNIRLAEKHGVEVCMTRLEKDIEDFLDIMESTAKRKSIHFHPRSYYQAFLMHFNPEQCELFVAKKDGKVLAGSLVSFYKNTAYYLHGGSGDTGRNIMAPYLLQWTQIKEAKKRGCTQYDFGGVAVKVSAAAGKDWSGITRFKQGFAPNTDTILFPGTYDIILKPRSYFLYRLLQNLKTYL